MNALATGRASVQTIDGSKVVPIDMLGVQCGACFGVFAVDKLIFEKPAEMPNCPYCGEVAEMTEEQVHQHPFALNTKFEFAE